MRGLKIRWNPMAVMKEVGSTRHAPHLLHGKLKGDGSDIESGQPLPGTSPMFHEHLVSRSQKLSGLSMYFACNVALTIYNKAVLDAVPVPWLLTAIHAGSAWIGCLIALKGGYYSVSRLDPSDYWRLAAFSLLFTVNIAISNVSLSMVTIPFHQIARATTPIFTTLIYRLFFSRRYSTAIYVSLVPVTLGVVIAAYDNDVMCTPLGFILTFIGVILAAVKTITTNKVMTGTLALGHWELLFWLSPLAFVQSCAIAWVRGEVQQFHRHLHSVPTVHSIASQQGTSFALVLAGNGILAFLLNVVSFNANKLSGALAMTVCANLKQCVTIVLGFYTFGDRVTSKIVCGIATTVAGGIAYNIAEMKASKT